MALLSICDGGLPISVPVNRTLPFQERTSGFGELSLDNNTLRNMSEELDVPRRFKVAVLNPKSFLFRKEEGLNKEVDGYTYIVTLSPGSLLPCALTGRLR